MSLLEGFAKVGGAEETVEEETEEDRQAAEEAARLAEEKALAEKKARERRNRITRDLDVLWDRADEAGEQQVMLWDLYRRTCDDRDVEQGNEDGIAVIRESMTGVVNAMESEPENSKVQQDACDILGNFAMSTNRAILAELPTLKAVQMVMSVMKNDEHVNSLITMELAIKALGRLATFAQKEIRQEVERMAPYGSILKAMKAHLKDNRVQKEGCRAIARIFRFLEERPGGPKDDPPVAAAVDDPDEQPEATEVLCRDLIKAVVLAADPTKGEDPQMIALRKKKGIPDYKNEIPIEDVHEAVREAVHAFHMFGGEEYLEELFYYSTGTEGPGPDIIRGEVGEKPESDGEEES